MLRVAGRYFWWGKRDGRPVGEWYELADGEPRVLSGDAAMLKRLEDANPPRCHKPWPRLRRKGGEAGE